MASSSLCNKRIGGVSPDKISELPDGILVSILSLLTLKEAGRTCVLSSRWRFLWTFFEGKMDFDDDEWKMKWPKLMRRINQIFKLHKGVNVERFRISFGNLATLDIVRPCKCVDKWIAFVAKTRVKILELKLSNFRVQPRFLQCLRLMYVRADANMVNYFLSKSPDLEMLLLEQVLNLSELRKIEIYASNLEVLFFFRYDIDIKIKDFHGLHYLYFGEGRTIALSKEDYQLVDMKNFSLPNVKDLHLIIAPTEGNVMLNCIHLLEAAPILNSLTIEFFWRQGVEGFETKLRPGMDGFDRNRMRPNRCIKVVKVVQYLELSAVDARFVKTLVDNTESLDKLIVAPYRAKPNFPMLPQGIEEQADIAMSERGFLQPRVELVIERDLDSC
ncbi:hypothetical protein BUALT_Bualt13G0007100 [Buddleja alternifolia]|uniref:F-box domain-containing protein n=1 Tax=Buddleja alternifolia TaxID=168488 RepID=A0AAV6WSV2_9LAMI|nr:hypothetical protein BUALT_Bualt13G0007100 [Buddleja alternifolia]